MIGVFLWMIVEILAIVFEENLPLIEPFWHEFDTDAMPPFGLLAGNRGLPHPVIGAVGIDPILVGGGSIVPLDF